MVGRGEAMKRLIGFVLLGLVPFLAVPSARAAQPVITRGEVDEEFVLEDLCAFPVDVHITGTFVDITTEDENGTHITEVLPQGEAVLTNVESGTSTTIHNAGPSFLTFFPDGSVRLVGAGGGVIFGIIPETGEPGIVQVNGRIEFFFDPEGNETFNRSGRLVDLCSALA
jgi:hypothetical protein